MRPFIIAVLVTIALTAACIGNVHAVGLYAVGKEECNCSSLVARGIIPDTLNKLHEALLLPQLAMVLDKIALAIKPMLVQTGGPSEATEEAIKEGEQAPELKEKPAAEKKPAKEEVSPKERKPTIQKKSIKGKKSTQHMKKGKKKKPVKMPPKLTSLTIS